MNENPASEQSIGFQSHQAAARGDLQLLQSLFREHPGELIKPDGFQRTLMHSAASGGATNVIEWLITVGFDVNAIDKFGGSPLFNAVYNDHMETVCLLKNHGAKLSVPKGNKIVAYFQFGMSLLALFVMIYIILSGDLTFSRWLVLWISLGICTLCIREGIMGLMGKRTHSNN